MGETCCSGHGRAWQPWACSMQALCTRERSRFMGGKADAMLVGVQADSDSDTVRLQVGAFPAETELKHQGTALLGAPRRLRAQGSLQTTCPQDPPVSATAAATRTSRTSVNPRIVARAASIKTQAERKQRSPGATPKFLQTLRPVVLPAGTCSFHVHAAPWRRWRRYFSECCKRLYTMTASVRDRQDRGLEQ